MRQMVAKALQELLSLGQADSLYPAPGIVLPFNVSKAHEIEKESVKSDKYIFVVGKVQASQRAPMCSLHCFQ